VTALADGGFVAAWEYDGQDGSGTGVYGQRYDADGNAQGAGFRINTTTADDQLDPSVTALSNGGFVVAWQSAYQDGSAEGVYAQRFLPPGAVRGTYWDDTIEGGEGADLIEGLAGNDWLKSGAGRDTLDGGAGADVLEGGAGTDVFVFKPADGVVGDTIADFEGSTDSIRIHGTINDPVSFGDLTITDSGGDAFVTWGTNTLTLEGLDHTLLTSDDFAFV